MGMTIAQKILATKSGVPRVSPGEIVDAYPDLVMSHTETWRSVSVMSRISATKLNDNDRLTIVMHHIGKLGADGAGYKSIEFYGDAMPQMSISERMTIANLAMEMGCKCVFVPPDARTEQYLAGRLKGNYAPVYADADAVYEEQITVNLSELTPMVACPHQVENTKPVSA